MRRDTIKSFYEDDYGFYGGITAGELIESEEDSEYSLILDQYGRPIKKPRERVPFGFVR